MSTYIDTRKIKDEKLREVWRVAEFCRQHSLAAGEEERLHKLLGDFATRHELLMNAERSPLFR